MRFSSALAAALAVVIASALLTACGQKGGLYLRDNAPAGFKPARPPVPKPVPYPADTDPAEKN